MFIKDHVNRRNTKTWVMMNEDSRAALRRKQFVDNHGGEFIRGNRTWVWQEKLDYIHDDDKKISMYMFIRPDGIRDLVENFSKYCRENELNKSTMFAVMRGSRSHHKGYTVKKLS